MILAGVDRRRRTDHQLRLHAAWMAAQLNAFAYHNPKKMPALDKIAGGFGRKRASRQGWEQQKMIVQALNAALGGKVIQRNG